LNKSAGQLQNWCDKKSPARIVALSIAGPRQTLSWEDQFLEVINDPPSAGKLGD